FFYCYSYHPYLHSFPTRRSSDLQLLSFALNVEIACLSVHIAVQSTCQWQNFVLNVDRHYLHSQPQRARAHFFNLSNLGKLTTQQTWMAAAKSGSPHLTKGV